MGPDATRRLLAKAAYAAQRLGGRVTKGRDLVHAADRHRAAVLVQWRLRAGLADAVDEPADRVERGARSAQSEDRRVERAHRAGQALLGERYREQQHPVARTPERELER